MLLRSCSDRTCGAGELIFQLGHMGSHALFSHTLFALLPPTRCDLVFLPPSFPIVAMENPCLTFIIASILESSEFLLIDVVHEIAHGWFGNAVTNATWEEMWLSEGLATYAQRRITSRACGTSARCYHSIFTRPAACSRSGLDPCVVPGCRSSDGLCSGSCF